jgi:RNA polymerase sigma factor (sigma-70 family)
MRMAKPMFEDVLDYLRKTCAADAARDLPDGELLKRFATQQDEHAFRALVLRHGPMVLGVCRRVLGDAQLAEDGFQATYLVLLRRAAFLNRRKPLASWLYGVAQRVALKARTAAARRQKRERRLKPMATLEPLDDLTWQELRSVLDEEMGRLPEKYRTPLLLCHLEGMSHSQAAAELGCPKRSLTNRLERGRELLRQRLVRRGITLSVATLSAALTEEASRTALGALLIVKTVKGALNMAAGKGVVGGSLSAGAVALAEEVLRGLATVKATVVVALALGLAIGSAGLAAVGGWTAREEVATAPTNEPKRDTQSWKTSEKDPPALLDFFGDPLPEGAVGRLGSVRFNHGGSLHSLFFRPDGKTLVSEGGGVKIWDGTTGKQVMAFSTGKELSEDHETALSPDGKYLTFLTSSFDHHKIRVLDLTSGTEARSVKLPVGTIMYSAVHRNALSPDGRLCALHLPVYRPPSFNPRPALAGENPQPAMADETAPMGKSQPILVYDTVTGKELCKLPNDNDIIRDVVFAGNDHLVTADKKQIIKVWDARSAKLVREFSHNRPVEVIAASADGSRLGALEHHNYAIERFIEKDVVNVWDLTTGKHLHSLPSRPNSWYMRVLFSPDGKKVFTTSTREAAPPWETTVWDVTTGKVIRALDGGDAQAVSPDGNQLAFGYQKFRIINLNGEERDDLEDSKRAWAHTAYLSPRGEQAFTLDLDSWTSWDATPGRRLKRVEVPFNNRTPPGLHKLSPDGRYVVTFSASNQQNANICDANIWDVRTEMLLYNLANLGGNTSIGFSQDSSILAACSEAGGLVVHILELQTGKELHSFPIAQSPAAGLFFTTDAKTLLYSHRSKVFAHDLDSGKNIYSWHVRAAQLEHPAAKSEDKGGDFFDENDRTAWRALAFSPNGATAAFLLDGGWDGRNRLANRVVICDARNGKIRRRMDDSGLATLRYEQVCFSADGRVLASSDSDLIHLWEVATGKEICKLRGHLGEFWSLGFSANGTRLISASTDHTCLIWDMARAVGIGESASQKFSQQELDPLWADLAAPEAAAAYAAIWRLAAASNAPQFLAEKLRPVPQTQVDELKRLGNDLGSDVYAVREKAAARLNDLGQLAEPELRRVLNSEPPLEHRLRIQKLLDNLIAGPTGGPLRTVRALAALEHAGTPQALKLLTTLAEGAPGAWLTEEAKAACARAAIQNQLRR